MYKEINHEINTPLKPVAVGLAIAAMGWVTLRASTQESTPTNPKTFINYLGQAKESIDPTPILPIAITHLQDESQR